MMASLDHRLLRALASCSLLVACSDSTTRNDLPQPPAGPFRSCGELDGVEPVEPVVVGKGAFDCPIFAPVPCTEPKDGYNSFCGEGCLLLRDANNLTHVRVRQHWSISLLMVLAVT